MLELSTPNRSLPPLNPKFCEWLGFKTCGDPELEKIARACDEWLLAFQKKQPARWLSLIGSSGTGKTFCAKKLWNYANKHSSTGRTVRSNGANWHDDMDFVPHIIFWPDFVQKLRAGKAFDLRDDMKRWPVLFLDDIGAERDPSGFAAEELNTLLGCRMGKWTLLTSNKDADALQAIDGRIYSRLIRDLNRCVGVNTVDFAER